MSAGVAHATPATPVIAGPQYIADNGPGRGHGKGHDDDWWWDGPPPPRYWDPIDACVGVQGPFGYVAGQACI